MSDEKQVLETPELAEVLETPEPAEVLAVYKAAVAASGHHVDGLLAVWRVAWRGPTLAGDTVLPTVSDDDTAKC